ncbi:hypothetical protein AKO1_005414 [Acrasis kona]|uniref:Protein phosphatase inhibitor 2 n=1 Tax=Acrasis kona TaxID=1008807 RepID=A0AAW2YMG7_9EUKA
MKGILKGNGQDDKQKCMKWDEQNLSENEYIQKDILANMGGRIEEPKTPFVDYILPDDPVMDVEDEDADHSFKASGSIELPSPREIETSSIRPEQQMERLNNAFRSGWDSDDDEDNQDRPSREGTKEEQLKRREQFEQQRKNHYNEFQMMKKLQEELSDEDDEL